MAAAAAGHPRQPAGVDPGRGRGDGDQRRHRPTGRARDRRDHRRPPPRRPAAHDRRPGRVRQGGAAGGARRAGRRRRPLGQGPADGDDGRPRRSVPSARVVTPPTRSSAGPSPTWPAARPWRPARCAGGPSSPRCDPTSHFVELRGNIARRLEQVPDGGAIVMAVAALEVLGLTDRVAERLDPTTFVPAAGQGCVAVECRPTTSAVRAALPRGRRRRDPPRRRARAGVPRRARRRAARCRSAPTWSTRRLHVFLAADDVLEPGRCRSRSATSSS